jgi:hypothetical protein
MPNHRGIPPEAQSRFSLERTAAITAFSVWAHNRSLQEKTQFLRDGGVPEPDIAAWQTRWAKMARIKQGYAVATACISVVLAAGAWLGYSGIIALAVSRGGRWDNTNTPLVAALGLVIATSIFVAVAATAYQLHQAAWYNSRSLYDTETVHTTARVMQLVKRWWVLNALFFLPLPIALIEFLILKAW